MTPLGYAIFLSALGFLALCLGAWWLIGKRWVRRG